MSNLRHKFQEGEINHLTEPFKDNEDMCDLARSVYGILALVEAEKVEPVSFVQRFVMQYFQKYDIGYTGNGRMVIDKSNEVKDENSDT